MLKVLISGAITLLGLDMLWLGYLGKNLYKTELRNVGRYINGSLDVVWYAAIIVYLAILFGVYYFVLPRVIGVSEIWRVFLVGGLFGATTYAIYDFTNLAVVKNWSLKISLVDLVWGFILCGCVTLVMWWMSTMK